MKFLFLGSEKLLAGKTLARLEICILDSGIPKDACQFVDIGQSSGLISFLINHHRAIVVCGNEAKEVVKTLNIQHPKPDILNIDTRKSNLKNYKQMSQYTRLLKDLLEVSSARQRQV